MPGAIFLVDIFRMIFLKKNSHLLQFIYPFIVLSFFLHITLEIHVN